MKRSHLAERILRFVRPDVAADVDDELQFHIDERIARNVALGMSEEAARRDAAARFGNVASVRQELINHDARQAQHTGRREILEGIVQDVRFGVRSLRRSPAFAIAAILTLAFGIGANAAVFSVVDAIVLRPLPYQEPQRLVIAGDGSAGEFVNLRERLRSYSEFGAYVKQTHPLDDGRSVVLAEGVAMTPNMLTLLGAKPEAGRAFTADDGVYGKHNVLLLSHQSWQRQFGGSRDAIGATIRVEGLPYTVIGVMPASFQFPDKQAQYWQPYAFFPQNVGMHWAVGGKRFVGRLRYGVTIEQADQELRAVWPGLRKLNPLWDPGDSYRADAHLTPLQSGIVGNAGKVAWALLGCVLAVLLIGCVNVANLLLARATARDREFGVRAALGGGRARLLRQLLTESLVLSVAGAVVGVAFAYAGVAVLVGIMPDGVPRSHEIAVNGTVLAFSAVVTVAAGMLFGSIPALRATQFVNRVATSGRRTTSGPQHHRVAGTLVAAEVALAVVLVICATLLVRSFNSLRSVEPGFETSNIVAARLTPPAGSYRDPAQTEALYTQALRTIRALPGVRATGAVDKLPLAQPVWGGAIRVEGQFEDARRPLPELQHWQMVTPDYFTTMGIAINGRAFTDADRDGSLPVAIISESFAKRFWPNDVALGKRIGYPYESPWLTVVGVVPDTKQDSLRETGTMSMYVPWQQRARMSGTEMWIVARTSSDAAALGGAIRKVVHDIDRSVPVSDIRTMDAVVSGSMQTSRFITLVVSAFAIGALILGAIGVYGVMSYLVGQRMREMGIRLALGAPAPQLIALVLRRAAVMAGAGAVIGVAAALLLTRSMRAMLYGISPTDPLTFVAVPVFFLLVAALASYSPARRAARLDPVRVLRAD